MSAPKTSTDGDRLFTPHNSNSSLTPEVTMSTTVSEPIITWEKLPDDFPLADDPVDNINQPLLAAALTESLELAGRIQPSMLIGTNFGICATVDSFLVSKAPDWFYVRSVLPTQPPNQNRRSYTPSLEGYLEPLPARFVTGIQALELGTAFCPEPFRTAIWLDFPSLLENRSAEESDCGLSDSPTRERGLLMSSPRLQQERLRPLILTSSIMQ